MPASTTAITPAAIRAPFDWAALNPLADLRVRHGIKVGLAAVLSLWMTQMLRLEHPNWSILAVLVLANAPYVGAIASKALMRCVGTVAGALLGVWVVGDYDNAPVVFLLVVFAVVAVAAYKSGQLASATWPYAYYLVGLALVSVATYGVTDPGNVWRYGLSRTLETLVGVVCATLLYAALWPRYAREEFITAAGETLKTVRALLAADARAYAGDAADPGRVGDLRRAFSRQIVGLRTLLDAGGRGSLHFRARLGNYQRFVVALTHLFQALVELHKRQANEGALIGLVKPEVGRLLAAVDADLGVLGDVASEKRTLPPVAVTRAYAELEVRVEALRESGTFRRADLDLAASEAFFGHLAALRSVQRELALVHELVGELPRKHLLAAPPHRRHSVLPALDPFWVREAIKAGLAVCLSFLLIRWVHPPGASGIPLGALVFSTFGRMSLTTGGTGDLRGFQRMFLTALSGVPVVAGLWLLMPLLSNYWAMNTLLFGLCYVFGFIVVRATGFSYGLQIMVLAISTLVGINPQVPVSFGALRDAYLGLLIGLFIGGTISRLLWPVLPQGLLRDNMMRFFEDLRALLGGCADQEYVLTGTVLLPSSALQAVDAMVLPRCPASERERLANFIRFAHPLGLQIAALRDEKTTPLAAPIAALLGKPLADLEAGFDCSLEALARCFRERDLSVAFPEIRGAQEAMDAAMVKVRDDGVGAAMDYAAIAHLLTLVNRYGLIAGQLQACREQIASLRLDDHLRDVAL